MAAVHRAHTTAIVFENLESSNGRPVELDVGHLVDKLVARRRGGYCFEHNMLLKAALEEMGLGPVDVMLARVRIGGTGEDRPLNHLLLRLTDRGRQWLADVGLGGGGLLDPIPFEVGVESDQSGWVYRLVEDGPELVVQVVNDGAWTDMYGFVPVPAPAIDVEVSNWYTATHPLSPFVTSGFFGRRSVDRCLTLFVFEQGLLVERPVGGASEITEVPRTEVPALLAQRFGIEGVTLGTNGRLDLIQTTAR
ncbi:MAG TPA: arylamine N-acetyltransferase [Acidimicrobiales bacterium]|nr:arylamine N-acetyltransferase [Acidimicrobiales bacterium]